MIDALTPSDAAAAAALSAGFGWPHRMEDWAGFLTMGQGLAWREGGVLLGTAMMFPLDAAHGTIGLVQVAASMQGRGLGRQLMQAAMALAGGRSLALHATAAGAGLYARLGFVKRGMVTQWQGVTTSAGAPQPVATEADFTELCTLDAAATGLSRSAVLRALFDASLVQMAGPAGSRTGYAMRRRFGRGLLVGPMVARDDAAAAGLLAGLLKPGFLRVDVTAQGGALAGALQAAGLVAVDEVEVMVRGDWPPPRGVWCVASQALG